MDDSRSQSHCTRLLLAYDGSPYSGWQIQPKGRTVQGLIEEALAKPLRGRHPIIGASRTDAGVHAYGQVAHFYSEQQIDPSRLCRSLNGLLPPSIRCLGVAVAEPRFHSQLWAKRKSYLYRLQLGPWLNPLLRHTTAHWSRSFCQQRFRESAGCFIGIHDFSALANENQKGQAARDAVRHVETIESRVCGNTIEVEFVGNGFLYKQVRNMMGCMLAAAEGSLSVHQIRHAMERRDRRLLPPPAPPEGLCLQWIDYGFPLEWQES
jgi:tRNA pseudouridine38-40 synthase